MTPISIGMKAKVFTTIWNSPPDLVLLPLQAHLILPSPLLLLFQAAELLTGSLNKPGRLASASALPPHSCLTVSCMSFTYFPNVLSVRPSEVLILEIQTYFSSFSTSCIPFSCFIFFSTFSHVPLCIFYVFILFIVCFLH